PQVLGRVGGIDIAAPQIAVDAIAFDPVIDDASTLLHHAADKLRGLFAVASANGIQAGIDAVDHLATIAARGTPADAGTFNHDDLEALFGQMQRCRQARITRPHHADVGL